MGKEKIHITYKELRKTHLDVIEFTSERAYWLKKKNLNRNTRIEEDLGFYGLDNEDFLIQFSEKFGVDFSKMQYEKYLTSEGEIANPRILLFAPLILIFNIGKFISRIIIMPFSEKVSNKIKKYKLPIIKKLYKKDITIGDLTTSLIKKEFYERKSITYEIKTA